MKELNSLLYVSRAAEGLTNEEVEALANRANEKNKELGISGYLYFSGQRFIQYIEGDDQAIFDLMDDIREDERHTVLREVVIKNIDKRLFPDWHMRRLTTHDFLDTNMEESIEHSITELSNTDSLADVAQKIMVSNLRMISSHRSMMKHFG